MIFHHNIIILSRKPKKTTVFCKLNKAFLKILNDHYLVNIMFRTKLKKSNRHKKNQ